MWHSNPLPSSRAPWQGGCAWRTDCSGRGTDRSRYVQTGTRGISPPLPVWPEWQSLQILDRSVSEYAVLHPHAPLLLKKFSDSYLTSERCSSLSSNNATRINWVYMNLNSLAQVCFTNGSYFSAGSGLSSEDGLAFFLGVQWRTFVRRIPRTITTAPMISVNTPGIIRQSAPPTKIRRIMGCRWSRINPSDA